VAKDEYGPLCEAVISKEKLAQVSDLVQNGKVKQLAAANELTMKLINQYLLGNDCGDLATQKSKVGTKAAEIAKEFLKTIGFDCLLFMPSAETNAEILGGFTCPTTKLTTISIFNIREMSDTEKKMFSSLTADNARSFIKELHDALPVVKTTSQDDKDEAEAAASTATTEAAPMLLDAAEAAPMLID
jgi:hypothetical protein